MFEKRSLGIAFEADGTVRAAELTSHVRTVTLTRVWTIEPGGEDNFDSWKQGVAQLRDFGVDFENVIVGIPDSFIFRKQLSFPFKSQKRIMQILNSELDGEIPIPIGEVVADFIPGYSSGSGHQGIAMACDTTTFSRFLEIFGPEARLRGVQTGSVGLASASIRAGIKEGVSVFCSPGEALLVEFRSSKVRTVKRLALSGDDVRDVQLLADDIRQHTVNEDEVYLGCGDVTDKVGTELTEEALNVKSFSQLDIVQKAAGVDVDMAKIAGVVGLALGGLGAAEALAFDLRQGPFKQVTPFGDLKGSILRTAILLSIIVLFGMASLVSSLHNVRGEYQGLKSKLEIEFAELLPDSKPVRDQEAAQMKGELEKLQRKMADLAGFEGRGAISVLAGLSAAVPEGVSLKLDELSYDSMKLRFEGSVSSFDAVDRIKEALDADPMFSDVQVQNARVGANINKVTFRMQMEVR